jgi:DNA-binding beta-propeller fold protein YncE
MFTARAILFPFLLGCLALAPLSQAQEITHSFPSPGGEARGLCWDGEYLWCADAGTDSVYKIDISDGTVVSSFAFPIEPDYGGITWSADSNIWIANGSTIHKVNPANGDVISSFSCPGG